MKRFTILLVCCLSLLKLSAQPITLEEAKQTALHFFQVAGNSNTNLKSVTMIKVDTFAIYYGDAVSQLKSSQVKEPGLFIFNRIDQPGFVIISGDKRIRDIIAYSNSAVFSDPNPGLKALLEQYLQEIEFARENDINANTIAYTYNDIAGDTWLLTSEWNQLPAPYNSLCPSDPLPLSNEIKDPTGCVATAIAQIINFNKYPRFGNSERSYKSKYRTESADFKNTEYKYELMEDKPAVGKNDQISTLLYHCGVAVNMVYDTGGSSSNIDNAQYALKTYFKYKDCDIKNLFWYSWPTWKQMIKDEIDNKRPIYYRADDDVHGGHAFVLDGYRSSDDTYHFNWGWSGSGNNYYPLTLLTPGIYNFKYNHKMIIGINPKYLVDLIPEYQSISATSVKAGSVITAYCSEVNQGPDYAAPHVISIHISVDDVLTPGENGDRYLTEINASALNTYGSGSIYSVPVKIPADLSSGNYYIFFSVDGGKVVDETDETNNFATKQITVFSALSATVNDASGTGSATLTCTTSGGEGESILYKWYSGTDCSGNVLSTNPTYTATTNGNYSCKAYINGYESTYSCDYGYATINYPGENIYMLNSASYTVCSANFYDGEGPTKDYLDNQDVIVTLYPATPGAKVSVTFNSFNTAVDYSDASYITRDDILFIYNGNSKDAPQIGAIQGSGFGTITSTAADGSLTFRFISYTPRIIPANGVRAGWSATISCSALPPNDITMIGGTFTTCGGNFYDAGGPSGDYMSNQNTTLTLYPATPGAKVSVKFDSFNTAVDYSDASYITRDDILYVYNGNSKDAPQIGAMQGVGYGTVTSTAADGSLTFQFISYRPRIAPASGVKAGWSATISCSSAPPDNITMIGGSFKTCGGKFYDAGGPNGDYMNNQNTTLTLYPATPGAKVSVTFDEFKTAVQYSDASYITRDDILFVYNGNTKEAPQIGAMQGVGYGTVTSTAADGSLTFQFISYRPRIAPASGVKAGWSATISCSPAPPVDITMLAGTAFVTCGGKFYDAGGPNFDYMNNQNSTLTLYPATAGAKVSVTFDKFNSAVQYSDASYITRDDILYIYNGNSKLSPQIGAMQGVGYGTVASTAADGSLTFQFVSYAPRTALESGVRAGWSATISCSSTPPNDINLIAGTSFVTCGGKFYDSGGPDGDYMNNQNTTLTLYPATPGAKVSVTFDSFNTAVSYSDPSFITRNDILTVYNGNSIAATKIGTLKGQISPITYNSTAADGSLTFNFVSYTPRIIPANGVRPGWSASISCGLPTASQITLTNVISGNKAFETPVELWSGNTYSTPKPLKICADGSSATHIKFVNNTGIASDKIRFWIQSDPYGSIPDISGYFIKYSVSGNTITAEYTHPKYLKSTDNGRPYRTDHIQIVDYTNPNPVIFSLPAQIYRAPILFVHGWLGDVRTFADMEASFQKDSITRQKLSLRVDYYKISNNGFNECKEVVPDGITALLKQCLYDPNSHQDVYSAGKVDLVAHSMGGVLSRTYLQGNYNVRYRNDVNRIITLNTPHSGSQLGDLGTGDLSGVGCMILEFLQNSYWTSCPNSVADLSVNSLAIDYGLNGELLNINIVPSSTISTEVDPSSAVIGCNAIEKILSSGLLDRPWSAIFGEANDMVVGVSSQNGGLTGANNFHTYNQFHMGSTRNEANIARCKQLLSEDPKSIFYSQDGFHPKDLKFLLKKAEIRDKESTTDGSVTITNPGYSKIFSPGDLIDINVTGTPNVAKLTLAVGSSNIPLYAESVMSSSGSFIYPVPDEAYGEIRIMAVGIDESGNFVGLDTLTLQIISKATLDSIGIYPGLVFVPQNGDSYLHITGYFSDGVERDLSYEPRVQYQFADNAMAQHFNPNIIRGLIVDSTELTVSYLGKSVKIPVIVYNSDISVSVPDLQPQHTAGRAAVNIYPNPSNGNFYIQYESIIGESLLINIYNQFGQGIYSEKDKSSSKVYLKEMTLKDLPPGIYYVTITTQSNQTSSKFVVVK